MNKMLSYLKGYKRVAALAPLFKMLEATFDLFVPLVMADIVNIGIAAHDFHYILVRCGLLLLLAFIGLVCSLTAQCAAPNPSVKKNLRKIRGFFGGQVRGLSADRRCGKAPQRTGHPGLEGRRCAQDRHADRRRRARGKGRFRRAGSG